MFEKKHIDFAVIGGGIIGAVVATLAKVRNPKLSIAVIDKNMVGHGATLFSAALSSDFSNGDYTNDLITRNAKIVQELKRFIDLPLIEKPCIHIVGNTELDRFNKSYVNSKSQAAIINASSLGELKIPQNKEIFLSKTGVHYVNMNLLLNNLYSFLRDNDCRVYEFCEVQNLLKSDDRTLIKCANNLEFIANKVCVSIGSWSNNSELANHSSENKKITAFHLNALPSDDDPIIMFFDENAFLLPLTYRKHWLYSITSDEWHVNPEDKLSISNNDLEQADGILNRYGINFSNLFAGGRVFCDSYSQAREISIQKPYPEIAIITGASGSGYRLSYGVADKVLEGFL